MARGDDAFNIRMPEGMRDQIRLLAEKNGRSMNAEIIARLDMTLGAARDDIPLDVMANDARMNLQTAAEVIDRLLGALKDQGTTKG